jgi:ADP-heptose:LPS heptosyltransferase
MKLKINKAEINSFRRKIMFFITKNIGSKDIQKPFENIVINDIKKVLILRPNHRLGNLLLTTPLIEEITNTFPNCKIDVLAKGNLAPILYTNYEAVKTYLLLPRKPFNQPIAYAKVWIKVAMRRYDLVINAVEGSSSGKLLTKIAHSDYKIFGGVEEELSEATDSIHMAKSSIYNLRYFLSHVKQLHYNNLPVLDLKLNAFEKEKGRQLLKTLVKNEKPIIAIFTYATGSKCYDTAWWNDFYSRLIIQYPEYHVLEILPIENVSQIGFQSTSFYSKDIREIASVIANTDLFIGADSGMMHLASASLIPTIGLFSKPNFNKYEPYGGANFSIYTQVISIDESIELINRILSPRARLQLSIVP